MQPVVYQYLRLFGAKAKYSRDEVSKLLRGTAIQQRDFERTGSTPWIGEPDRVITRVPIYERFQKMVKRSRRELKTELDQSHFLIGAAMPAQEGDTSVNIEKEFERETFLIRPGVEALLDWYSKTPAGRMSRTSQGGGDLASIIAGGVRGEACPHEAGRSNTVR